MSSRGREGGHESGRDEVTVAGSAPDDDAFRQFVESHPTASIYHHPDWLATIEQTYGLAAFHVLAWKDGSIRGFLPLYGMRTIRGERVGVSSPFSNYGGPLASDAGVADRLLETAAEIAAQERWSYLEVKERQASSHPGGWQQVDHFCSPVLDLESLSAEEVWKQRLRAKTRNQVRKAEKSGLELREGLGQEFDDFLSIYYECMRDLGTPGHGTAWFQNLQRNMGSRLLNLVVYREGQPIGGALLLREGQGGILQYCLCLRSFLRLCPNNMLYWGAIEHGVESGWRYLDFGRSRFGEGTHRFKLQWGAEDAPTPYAYHIPANSRRSSLPDLHPANPAFDLFIRTWRVLPVPVVRVLGPRVRPHIPT
jgi:FemAB-related protein (PEP-CTERM system-associated)